ncbi:MAG: radical SAM family heme chaperone HemW [Candidatus Accumulibacter sp.]|nr:radical SAM family heme chaperone HemW [Accumulibacter sp.]
MFFAEKNPAIPLSLYVHIPWCIRKCPYCDFNSYGISAPGAFPESRYIAALTADLDTSLPFVGGREIRSVFFGGGTPSLLSGEGIARLLSVIRERLSLSPSTEITLEANPGAVESGKFAVFSSAGVNRLSLGIQSFDANCLKAAGRIHDDKEAYRAVEIAALNFPVFNLDLMYGLPRQTPEQVETDIGRAIRFSPAHLSCYQLTLEADTAFGISPPELPDADACADMQELVEEKLAAAGYRHYEISAFARPGKECVHNLNYWTFGDYLGIGAGAHSKLTRVGQERFEIFRQTRWRRPERYIEEALSGCAVEESFRIVEDDLPLEFMMNALRLTEGFDVALFETRTFLPFARIESILAEASTKSLLKHSGGRTRPTLQGQRFLNRLLAMFA